MAPAPFSHDTHLAHHTYNYCCVTIDRQGFIQASRDAKLQRRFLNQLKQFTCAGAPVSKLYNCINDGRLCSDAGACTNNECVCDSGREGQYCEGFVSASSSSDASTIAIGSCLNSAQPTI
jgi:hypothetical protein